MPIDHPPEPKESVAYEGWTTPKTVGLLSIFVVWMFSVQFECVQYFMLCKSSDINVSIDLIVKPWQLILQYRYLFQKLNYNIKYLLYGPYYGLISKKIYLA